MGTSQREHLRISDEVELAMLEVMRDGPLGRDVEGRRFLARKVGRVWARTALRSIEQALDRQERSRGHSARRLSRKRHEGTSCG